MTFVKYFFTVFSIIPEIEPFQPACIQPIDLLISVFKSSKHIYAQVFSVDGTTILAQASTLDKSTEIVNGGNSEAAAKVGELIAERAIENGIKKVTFDRSGYKYHGRVKIFADTLRKNGMEF